MGAARRHPHDEDDELVFSVCQRFLDEMAAQFGPKSPAKAAKGKPRGAAAVAQWLKTQRNRPDLNRERVYPLLAEGARRGFLLLRSPRNSVLAQNLAFKYEIDRYQDDATTIQVVDVDTNDAHTQVAVTGAHLVHELIKRLGKKKDPVHIGLGPGNSARIFAKRLGQLLSCDSEGPDLTIHALSSAGQSVENPDTAPVTFFQFFRDTPVNVKFVGLFTEAVVRCEDYQHVIEGPSVQASFDEKDEIDIVVTAFNAAYCSCQNGKQDHHCGILGTYLDAWDAEGETRHELDAAGWKGHVQFLPYSDTGPIEQSGGIRAVVLFELAELIQLARREDKYVVLLAGPCRDCGMIRSEALLPLVSAEELRVWTHLVLDIDTARQLTRPAELIAPRSPQ